MKLTGWFYCGKRIGNSNLGESTVEFWLRALAKLHRYNQRRLSLYRLTTFTTCPRPGSFISNKRVLTIASTPPPVVNVAQSRKRSSILVHWRDVGLGLHTVLRLQTDNVYTGRPKAKQSAKKSGTLSVWKDIVNTASPIGLTCNRRRCLARHQWDQKTKCTCIVHNYSWDI